MDPLWYETCWSTFKYFIILIVSTYYILCISWVTKCLNSIDARCKHEDSCLHIEMYTLKISFLYSVSRDTQRHVCCGLVFQTHFAKKTSYFWLSVHSEIERNRLTPNDDHTDRTAPLTSKICILYIYSTNIGTEYFKRGIYCPFFFPSKCSLFHNSNIFGSCIIHILYTGRTKIKKK